MRNTAEPEAGTSSNEDSNLAPAGETSRNENFSTTTSSEPASSTAEIFKPLISVVKDISYADVVKNHLPSLLECEDAEIDDILMLDDIIEREKKIIKKESTSGMSNKNYVMFLYK
jgi:baculoviral IAP repeat-containing protein 6